MYFEIVGDIAEVEVIAVGRAIRELPRLNRVYGKGNWRKLKGTAQVVLPGQTTVSVEIHWYEAHGIGRKEYKIKRFIK